MKYEYQAEGSRELAKEIPWWKALKFSKTNMKGMFCVSMFYPHRLCWDWTFWYGLNLYPKKAFWFFYKMDLPGVYQWGLNFLWLFNVNYASQKGKSDWMLKESAEKEWNRRLDSKPSPPLKKGA